MTYREAIQNLFQNKEVEGVQIFSFGALEFIRTTAILLLYDCDLRLSDDVPDFEIDGHKRSGKAKARPTFMDYASILNGNDFVRSFSQVWQWHSFLRWLMDQPLNEKEIDGPWFSVTNLGEMLNKHSEILVEEED